MGSRMLRKSITGPSSERFVDPIAGRVPRTLSVYCLDGLSRDPERRFTDALALDDALQAWLEGKNPIVLASALRSQLPSGNTKKQRSSKK